MCRINASYWLTFVTVNTRRGTGCLHCNTCYKGKVCQSAMITRPFWLFWREDSWELTTRRSLKVRKSAMIARRTSEDWEDFDCWRSLRSCSTWSFCPSSCSLKVCNYRTSERTRMLCQGLLPPGPILYSSLTVCSNNLSQEMFANPPIPPFCRTPTPNGTAPFQVPNKF